MLPTLKKGSSGNNVKVAKYLMGYNTKTKATSSFNTAFQTYVKKWQKEHGIKDDGVIGDETWTMVAKYAPSTKDNKYAIYALQMLLGGLSINGKMNTATLNTLLTFQRAAGLPEDGVANATTWKELIALVPKPHKHTYNFKQNEPQWADIPYTIQANSNQTIGNSGCGPTSAASVVRALTNCIVSPVTMASQAKKWGFRKATGGTDGGFFPKVGELYGLRVVETKNKTIIKHCIDRGGYVICSFKPGSWWTKTGHWSPMWSYDNTYFYVDNTISTLKIKRKLSYLLTDCRTFYCFYPKR